MKDLKIVYEWLKGYLKEWLYSRPVGTPVISDVLDSRQDIAIKDWYENQNREAKIIVPNFIEK